MTTYHESIAPYRRRKSDTHVRVTPDMVVAAVNDAAAPLIASGDPDQIAIAHAVARAVGMLQR
jgi:hypothetical protein